LKKIEGYVKTDRAAGSTLSNSRRICHGSRLFF
jgi:hypothetical protein